MAPKDHEHRRFTNDICDNLRSHRASRRTRRAEAKLQKKLRRAEGKEHHQMQIMLMADQLSQANADKQFIQARNNELEHAAEVTDLLGRAERLTDSHFADPDVSDLLKCLIVQEGRVHAASGAATDIRNLACFAIEDSENTARALLADALKNHMAVLRAYCLKTVPKSVTSDCTQTDPKERQPLHLIQGCSLVLATKRVVLTAQHSASSQPDLKWGLDCTLDIALDGVKDTGGAASAGPTPGAVATGRTGYSDVHVFQRSEPLPPRSAPSQS
eukprot:TRINITY_DN60112_c0_g1_i1.p1 TRINITY_DN60112_c0_g1~~TRINITY_DN60112_c0_g1_i1.p1  ORF type:complete len:301 (+),score=74.88 TRINITY_DN60112_c0_g1_i1:89-904(+)